MNRIVLVGGGARSGKSAFALSLARGLGARRGFVATGQAFDAEMAARIAEHARTRGDDFRTIEEPVALPACLDQLRDLDVVVVDCLTLWLSNLMLRDEPEALLHILEHGLGHDGCQGAPPGDFPPIFDGTHRVACLWQYRRRLAPHPDCWPIQSL